MSAFSGLDLPALPAPFKPLQAYLQRAEELRTKDPIIAYWCIYYSAQVGISLKVKESSCRGFLVSILDLLEKMKSEVGANDAIDMEAASAAYVENFALRVFTSADNEDRAGKATRPTAKKFLAAANFLEVLKVFPQSEISEGMEAKIKYAKWKAADISKAFREGRKPTPGPAGIEDDPMLIDGAATPTTTAAGFDLPVPPSDNGLGTPTSTNPPTLNRSSASPTMDVGDIQRANSNFVPISSPPSVPADKEVTPGMWSTAATPGIATPDEPPHKGQDVSWQPNASSSGHARTGSMGSTLSATSKTSASSGSCIQSPPPSATPSSPMATSSPPPPPPVPVVPAAAPYQPPPAAVELTSQVIAKAQKHCRFAISALDYEDADTARKQLREALAVLGG